nr:cellulose binding domain-containing protein [Motilibacter deserti]
MAIPYAAAPAQAAVPKQVDSAVIVTESLPLGHFVTAVAIKYTTRVDTLGAPVPTSAFTVVGTRTSSVNGAVTTAPRTVVRAYTNDEPERAAQGTRGKYLILELSTDDANAGALQYTGGINNPYQLSYSVTQTADVLDARGRLELAASALPVTTTSTVTPIVDDFLAATFTSTAGQALNYRLFVPEAYRDKPRAKTFYPMVVFLHGGGERGLNNLSQITANQGATAFADPSRQATDPSFVLAAQVPAPPAGQGWTTPAIQAALIQLIDSLVADYPVDPDRLYLTGLSLGGIGSFDILPRYPTKFAGAIIIAASGDPARMPLMKDVPIWVTHSVDDPTVSYTNGSLRLVNALEAAGSVVVRDTWPGNLPEPEADARALALWQQAQAAGSHTLFTTYAAGTTPVSAHWSWVPTYLNDTMIDWLYAQERANGASCDATVRTSSWSGGFSGAVVVTNTGTKPIADWTVSWQAGAGQQVTSAWPGTLSQSGTTVTVSAPAFSSSIQPGKSLSIGFNATGTAGTSAPAVTVNGAVCG